jgi:protein-disulfide isomerase
MRFSSLALSLLISSTVAFQASAEPVQKEELGELVREYLIKNPTVIQEVMMAYQKQAQDEGLKLQRMAINDHKSLIYGQAIDPKLGKDGATIVEFFDYNCSACKYMFKSLDAVLQDKNTKVNIIFKEFPIFGEESKKLARMGLAINTLAPEKYYEFHKAMMLHEGKLDVATAFDYAEKIGFSRDALEKELAKESYNKALDVVADLGNKLSVRGTPFLIINDEPVPHAVDEAELRKYIAKATEPKPAETKAEAPAEKK